MLESGGAWLVDAITPDDRQPERPRWDSAESPRHAVLTFMQGMEAEREGRGGWRRAALTLPPGDEAALRRSADALYDVLLRLAPIEPIDVPHADALREGQTRYELFPRGLDHQWIWQSLDAPPDGRVVLAEHDGRWRFTASTLAGADRLARSLAPIAPWFEHTPPGALFVDVFRPTCADAGPARRVAERGVLGTHRSRPDEPAPSATLGPGGGPRLEGARVRYRALDLSTGHALLGRVAAAGWRVGQDVDPPSDHADRRASRPPRRSSRRHPIAEVLADHVAADRAAHPRGPAPLASGSCTEEDGLRRVGPGMAGERSRSGRNPRRSPGAGERRPGRAHATETSSSPRREHGGRGLALDPLARPGRVTGEAEDARLTARRPSTSPRH